jgi:hypothetical protein
MIEKAAPAPDAKVGEFAATEDGLKAGLDQALRALAAATDDPIDRCLVDEANDVRPWSLV